jgi:hypothetical protein
MYEAKTVCHQEVVETFSLTVHNAEDEKKGKREKCNLCGGREKETKRK